MSADGPALVVLAAGASTRLGEPKALAQLGEGPGQSALEILLSAGAHLGDARPLVITGRDHEALVALAPAHVELFQNEAWSAGRSTSVSCAAGRRPGRDLCLAPIDVPLVPGAVFAALANEWARCGRPANGWLAPWVLQALEQRFGHPVIVGRKLVLALKNFPCAAPLTTLRALAAPLLALGVASLAILDDLDTPADLARLRARGRER